MSPEPEKRPDGYELARCCGTCVHMLRAIYRMHICGRELDGGNLSCFVEPTGTCPQWQPRDEREGADAEA